MTILRVVVLIAAVLILVVPVELPGCGGEPPTALFVVQKEPEDPAGEFAHGKLGILQPEYRPEYLVIAYRYLVGVGMNDAERRAVFSFPTIDPGDPAPWNEARSKYAIPGKPPVKAYRTVAQTGYLAVQLNCSPDALRTAALTLADRAAKFGASSPVFKDWVEAQDTVFSNCEKGESIPGPTTHPELRADRDYQIAAAKFYARQFDQARADFERIALDRESPWRESGPYLAARCLIRQDRFAEADERLAKMIADPSYSEWHDRARRLRDYVGLHTRPAERRRELGHALIEPNSEKTIAQDLIDYTHILGSQQPADDLTDWISTFRSKNGQHALERWEETKSIPWLVAALGTAQRADAAAPDLIAAAREVRRDSPAYVMTSYYALKLLAPDEERQRAAELLKAEMPVSARNLILAERIHLARNWDEYLRDALRQPVGETTIDGDVPEPDPRQYLGDSAGAALNEFVPVAVLRQLSQNKVLPAHVREEVARTAFVRSVLLSPAPKFEDVFTLLHSPGITPWVRSGFGRRLYTYSPGPKAADNIPTQLDPLRNNWWTAFKPSESEKPEIPPFLSESEQKRAAGEWKRLTAMPSGVDWLGAQTIAFAHAHPDDPRVPEALHLVVRASRYSFTDKDTGEYSHRAFTLLHKRYPQTEWAKKTPYWFQ